MPSPGYRLACTSLLAVTLSGLTLLATASPAGATTLRRMDLAELVASADRIVHARAVGSAVYWDPTGTQIFTDTTFEVLDELKGGSGAPMVVSLLGGRIDPVEMLEEGTPVFGAGDEVVLFTLNLSDGRSGLAGFTQGVMRVLTEPAGDKIAVSEVPIGVTLLQTSGPQPAVVRPSPLRAPLADLLENIRQMVAGTLTPGPTISATPDTDPVAPGGEIQ